MAFWLGSRYWCMALRNTGKPIQSSKNTHGNNRSHTKPQKTTTTQRRTHHTTRQQQSTTWCTQERSSPPDTTTKNEAPHHNTTHKKLAHHSTTPEELAHHKRRANAMWLSPQPKTENNFSRWRSTSTNEAHSQRRRLQNIGACRSNKIQFAQSSDLPGRTQNQTFGTSSEQSMQNTKAV